VGNNLVESAINGINATAVKYQSEKNERKKVEQTMTSIKLAGVPIKELIRAYETTHEELVNSYIEAQAMYANGNLLASAMGKGNNQVTINGNDKRVKDFRENKAGELRKSYENANTLYRGVGNAPVASI